MIHKTRKGEGKEEGKGKKGGGTNEQFCAYTTETSVQDWLQHWDVAEIEKKISECLSERVTGGHSYGIGVFP